MNKHFYLGPMHILKIFAVLYPICPGYFSIGGMQVRELILTITAIMLILLSKTIVVTKKDRSYPVFFEIMIWSGIFALIQIYHSEWIILLSQVMLWIVVIFFGSKVINTKERFLEIVDCLIWGGIFVGLCGLAEEFTHFNFFSLINTIGTKMNYNPNRLGILRIISFTSHAISYGCYCMIILTMVAYRLTIEKKRFLYFAGVLMLVNEVFAMSRGPMIGLAIEGVLILWFSGHQAFLKKVFKWIMVLVIMVLLACVVSNKVRTTVKLSGYVVLAMFDDDYAARLAEYGFKDNAGGIGNRIDLYKWVYEEAQDSLWLGKGAYKQFEHKFINSGGYVQTKSSIEVEWLRTFFRYGYIGLYAEIFLYLALILHSLYKKLKTPTEWEGHLSYARVVAALLIGYVVVMFSVMQNQEVQALSVVILLLVAYARNKANDDSVNEYETVRSN
ncbi:MAG: O-antigen ligase family protein [Lachnospiraceae bacterium]|nr:O-antigen ligase family protein [Lachnospiraceae bacterium]